jgi:hypothetical protein
VNDDPVLKLKARIAELKYDLQDAWVYIGNRAAAERELATLEARLAQLTAKKAEKRNDRRRRSCRHPDSSRAEPRGTGKSGSRRGTAGASAAERAQIDQWHSVDASDNQVNEWLRATETDLERDIRLSN